MKKSKLLVIGLIAGMAMGPPWLAWASSGIVGSPHDFTANTNAWIGTTNNWVPNDNVCEECHTIHKAQGASGVAGAGYQAAGPLWAHSLNNTAPNYYTPFNSPQLTLDGYPSGGSPGWSSLACLSCHDGNSAINQANGSTATGPTIGQSGFVTWARIAVGGTDLSGTHPIGVDYTTCQTADGYLYLPSTTITNAAADNGKTILQEMLFNETSLGTGAKSTMVECASCHDIHQEKGMSGTLRDSLKIGTATTTQGLCLTCHIK